MKITNDSITIRTIASEILDVAFSATDASLSDFSDMSEVLDLLSTVSENTENTGDFTIELPSGEVRVIHSDYIDQIQQEELESDLYILGCFNADFLSGILDIDSDVIETMQKSEAFEAVGKLVVSMGKLEELQQEYSSLDGYGHHFNHYDGEEYVVGDWYIFRTN